MRSYAPSPLLAPFVQDLMVVEVHETTTRVRLPEPGLVLGVRYSGAASLLGTGGEARLPNITLTGIMNVARRMRTEAHSGIVLARFRPDGAAQFLPHALHEHYGTTMALDEIMPRAGVDRLRARVAECGDDRARVVALEAFLVARLGQRDPDPLVAAAVRAIEEAQGALQIGALARRLAISQDPLEKRFRRVVGASPKQFASLLRVRRAVEAYRPEVKLAALALEAGYFDQSHFSRELRAVTGETPGRFFRAGEYR
jgi:transcriptional regulator GlxA family with amidase domain